MARPTAAQRQARAGLDAREKAATERAEQTHSAELSARTGALGRSASPSTDGPAYDPLLTVDQVSDWLGVPKGTLYQWRSRSRGPRAIKVGNGIRYRRSEIENYLDLHTDARPA
jgi:excisionase family DNA binding protein